MQGSPYVEQIEKYASSLKQLSHTFLELEAHKEEFSGADIDGMFDRVKERVCKKCEKERVVLGRELCSYVPDGI